MRTRALAFVVAAVALLAAPATAPAAIDLDVGMAGVTLGMKDEDVIKAIGPPTTTRGKRDDNGGIVVHWYFQKLRLKLLLQQIEPNTPNVHVTTIRTRAGAERTSSGVGVGTPERKLRSTVRGVKCDEYRRAPGRRAERVCYTKGRLNNTTSIGRDQTLFDISPKTRRIAAVSVSRFFD